MTELFRAVASADLTNRLGWTLLHSLWLGAIVGVAFACAMAILRGASAAGRYLVSCFCLALIVALPLGAFVLVPHHSSVEDVPTPLASTPPPLPAPSRISSPPPAISPTPAQAVIPVAPDLSPPPVADRPPLHDRLAAALEPVLPWAVLAWLAGLVLLASWQLAGWFAVDRLRRLATEPADASLAQTAARLAGLLKIARPIRVLESALVRVPTVIGALRPAILVPIGMAAGLSPQQIEAILAHELAHIRRHDYLVNLLQLLVETLMFYHPAVWLISRRIRLERENCCDDAVVALGAEPLAYAESLLHLATMAAAQPGKGAAGMAMAATGKPSQLRKRIAHILGADRRRALVRSWSPAALALAVLFAISLAACFSTSRSATPIDATKPDERQAAGDLAPTSSIDAINRALDDIEAAHEKNTSLIHTWAGTTDAFTTHSDAEGTSGIFHVATTFVEDRLRDEIRLAYVVKESKVRNASHALGDNSDAGESTEALLRPDGYFWSAYDVEPVGTNAMQKTFHSAPRQGRSFDSDRFHFRDTNPNAYMGTMLSYMPPLTSDFKSFIEGTRAILARTHPPDSWTVERSGKLVVFREAFNPGIPEQPNFTREMTFDLGKGGLWVRQTYSMNYHTRLSRVTYTMTPENIKGIWLPSHATRMDEETDGRGGSNTRTLKVTFVTRQVNEPVSESEFTLQAIGADKGLNYEYPLDPVGTHKGLPTYPPGSQAAMDWEVDHYVNSFAQYVDNAREFSVSQAGHLDDQLRDLKTKLAAATDDQARSDIGNRLKAVQNDRERWTPYLERLEAQKSRISWHEAVGADEIRVSWATGSDKKLTLFHAADYNKEVEVVASANNLSDWPRQRLNTRPLTHEQAAALKALVGQYLDSPDIGGAVPEPPDSSGLYPEVPRIVVSLRPRYRPVMRTYDRAHLPAVLLNLGEPVDITQPATHPAPNAPAPNDPAAAERRVEPEVALLVAALARAAENLPRAEYADIHTYQHTTGLDLGPLLRLTGQDRDFAGFPTENSQWQPAVKALADRHKVWALAALLDHPNVDVKIIAARALLDLADPLTAPVLLAAARRNDYPGKGSESATLHELYRSVLRQGLEKITGQEIKPTDVQTTNFYRAERWIRLNLQYVAPLNVSRDKLIHAGIDLHALELDQATPPAPGDLLVDPSRLDVVGAFFTAQVHLYDEEILRLTAQVATTADPDIRKKVQNDLAEAKKQRDFWEVNLEHLDALHDNLKWHQATGENEIRMSWFMGDAKVAMLCTADFAKETVTTSREVYDWAHQDQETRNLSHPQAVIIKGLAEHLPSTALTASDRGVDAAKELPGLLSPLAGKLQVRDVLLVTTREGGPQGSSVTRQYDRRNLPEAIRRLYDLTGAVSGEEPAPPKTGASTPTGGSTRIATSSYFTTEYGETPSSMPDEQHAKLSPPQPPAPEPSNPTLKPLPDARPRYVPPPALNTERFFSTEGPDDQFINIAPPVEAKPEEAAKIFSKDAPGRLAADWNTHLPPDADLAPPVALAVPPADDNPHFVKAKDTRPLASVAQFSDKHLVVRICKPVGEYRLGDHLWRYRDNLATVLVQRTPELDQLFGLEKLTKDFAGSYKGISQGDSIEKMFKALGPSESFRLTDAQDVSYEIYDHGRVEILVVHSRVQWVRFIAPATQPATAPEQLKDFEHGDVPVWRW